MKPIQVKSDIQNWYHFRLLDAVSKEIRQEFTIHNTVTDYWKNTVMPMFFTSGKEQSFALCLGTGEGQHTSSDTELFSPLYALGVAYGDGTLTHVAGESHYSWKISLTFDESTANGNLTELAIGRGSHHSTLQVVNPMCIANFQDAEGHTIIIEKTDSTVLQLDIELQLTLDVSLLPSNVHIAIPSVLFKNSPHPCMSKFYNDWRYQGDFSQKTSHYSYPSFYCYGTVASWMLPVKATEGRISLNPNKGLGYCSNFWSKTNGTVSKETTENGDVYRVTVSDMAKSAEANLATETEIYQIMSLGCDIDTCVLGIDFPDSDIFPPVELEFQIVGDGETTDFNLPVPILSQALGCVVTVNSVEMASTEYDWYGVNYQTIQPWIVTDWNNVVSCDDYYASSWGSQKGVPTSPYRNSAWEGHGNSEIIYDFGSAISVDCVGRLSSNGVNGIAHIYYSLTDPYEWVEVKSWTTTSEYGLEHLDTPINARYWKINPNVVGHTANQQPGMPVIGVWDTVTKPTIRFHTAPAEGQTVHIKAYSEYPLKSSDWIYQTVSFDISKGAVT